jgi:protein gp37
MSTTIEWTHRPGTKGETWNPVRGCSLVSQGCTNCYAMIFAHRFSGPGRPYEGLTKKTNSGVKWNGKIHLAEDMLELPFTWEDPRTVFVNSMSDLFHDDVPFEYIDRVFDIMDANPQHTFLILTKRANLMLEFYKWKAAKNGVRFDWPVTDKKGYQHKWPLPNVWLGVSCEDQKTADERIPLLLQVPAAIRFLSCEPLLGPIDFNKIDLPYSVDPIGVLSIVHLLHWVIAGGESGNGARPMHPDWVRSLRDQCAAAEVPFFFKQWGAYIPLEEHGEGDYYSPALLPGTDISSMIDKQVHRHRCQAFVKVGKSKSGNLFDGKQHLEFPKPLNISANEKEENQSHQTA